MITDEQHEKGLQAARAVAQWHLGYPYWADKLVSAYLDPERALEALRAEKQKPSDV